SEEFLNEKGDALTKCSKCRNNLKMVYLKNKLQGPIISHMNITEIVYNTLISLNNTNDFYEEENEAHVETSLEIKKFIQDNIYCSSAKICHQIRENQINGYKCITIQQTYYWWIVESQKQYYQHSDFLLSSKLLLEEFNLKIIVDHLNLPIPALEFLTTLFYRLIHSKFDAIEIDATYSTNNLSWELYAIMGVIDGTGFPLSYLLISARKNKDITRILTCWMQALKEQHLNNFPFILNKLVNIFDLENLQNSQNHQILSVLFSQDKIIEHEDDYIIESSDKEQDKYESELAYLHEILDKTKKLLEELRNKPKRHL
ncbi:24089_t:CDS:2, partial [Racocetra persica]